MELILDPSTIVYTRNVVGRKRPLAQQAKEVELLKRITKTKWSKSEEGMVFRSSRHAVPRRLLTDDLVVEQIVQKRRKLGAVSAERIAYTINQEYYQVTAKEVQIVLNAVERYSPNTSSLERKAYLRIYLRKWGLDTISTKAGYLSFQDLKEQLGGRQQAYHHLYKFGKKLRDGQLKDVILWLTSQTEYLLSTISREEEWIIDVNPDNVNWASHTSEWKIPGFLNLWEVINRDLLSATTGTMPANETLYQSRMLRHLNPKREKHIMGTPDRWVQVAEHDEDDEGQSEGMAPAKWGYMGGGYGFVKR